MGKRKEKIELWTPAEAAQHIAQEMDAGRKAATDTVRLWSQHPELGTSAEAWDAVCIAYFETNAEKYLKESKSGAGDPVMTDAGRVAKFRLRETYLTYVMYGAAILDPDVQHILTTDPRYSETAAWQNIRKACGILDKAKANRFPSDKWPQDHRLSKADAVALLVTELSKAPQRGAAAGMDEKKGPARMMEKSKNITRTVPTSDVLHLTVGMIERLAERLGSDHPDHKWLTGTVLPRIKAISAE